MSQEIYKQAITALFEGRATPLQKALISEWLIDHTNQELYFLWLEEWELQNPQFITDSDFAFQRLPNTIEVDNQITATLPATHNRINVWGWLVASMFILMAASGYIFRDLIWYQHYQTAFGEIQKVSLPDGSQVMLNANSALQVPRFGFGSDSREVLLNGEAEFIVKHLPNHRRFIVRTPDQLEVQVLGTEFMVYSRSRGSKVVLNKGKVQLRSLKSKATKPLVITSGDVVTISTKGQLTLRHNQSLAIHADWKDHRFTFDNTTVTEIAYQITERFGVQVVIADSSLANRTLGGTFKAETAEQFLQVMADILEVKIVRNAYNGRNPQTYTLTHQN